MCGISGFITFKPSLSRDELDQQIRGMIDRLRHRGPDDSGQWVDETSGIALGHNRLSIIDLSPTGHQPMRSKDQRFTVVFNGEMYNFQELRKTLEGYGYSYRGTSDTEVFLTAIDRWGVQEAVTRAEGMFATAIWDAKERALWLVRDRLGKKPLFYGWVGKSFAFASELKALRTLPNFDSRVDPHSLEEYTRHHFVPAPRSIYRTIRKLPPGALLKFSTGTTSPGTLPRPEHYWSLQRVIENIPPNQADIPFDQAVTDLDVLLSDAVRKRMIADVELGAFLSGGIDSSTVVALMQALSTRPVRTFTIGFQGTDADESPFATAIASHLKTDHTVLQVDPLKALEVIPKLPEIFDEPFGDSSGIPTYLVSGLTRRHVTVSLSGDGGDEVFAGYNRYLWGRSVWNSIAFLPVSLRPLLARLMLCPSPAVWTSLGKALKGSNLPGNLGDKVQKLALALPARTFPEFFFQIISIWRKESPLATPLLSGTPGEGTGWTDLGDPVRNMMYLDTLYCLPDDMLTKVDRASMAHGLEVRCPLLDHRVVEFAWKLPIQYLVQGRTGKRVLREVLKKYVPAHLFERPKQGFSMPLGEWLRGSLRPWVEELLSETNLNRQGIWNGDNIRSCLAEHMSGKRERPEQLWNVLMLAAWFEQTGATV